MSAAAKSQQKPIVFVVDDDVSVRESLDFCQGVGAKVYAGPIYAAVGKARHLPAEERKAEFSLQVANLPAQSRLGELQLQGRAGDILRFRRSGLTSFPWPSLPTTDFWPLPQ